MGFNCYQVKKFETNDRKTNKWSFRDHNYGLWYIKDSRNISGVVGIFFFLLMMIIFFSNVRTRHEDSNDQLESVAENHITRSFRISLFSNDFCLYGDTNILVCKNVNLSVMKEVQAEINEKTSKISDRSNLSLSFIEIEDTTKVIQYKWLNNLVDIKLHSLIINGTDLTEIRENSFEGNPFENLSDLFLISTGQLRLTDKSFFGLRALKSLSIQGTKYHLISAEIEALFPLYSLSSLQITGCILEPLVLKNLTGGTETFHLPNLEILDIGDNTLLGILLNDSFTKIPNVESLYLQRSDTREGLDPFVFRGIHPEQIYMETMQLTKLPEKIFDSFIDNVNRIYLAGNHWNCTCDFQWFQDFYKEHKSKFGDQPLYCYFNDRENIDLSTFNFCGSTTTNEEITSTSQTGHEKSTTVYTTTDTYDSSPYTKTTALTTSKGESTSDRTTMRTTANPDNYDPTRCSPANRSSPSLQNGKNIPRIIFLGRENFRFAFMQIGDEPKYIVSLDKALENDWVLIIINPAGWILCLSGLHDNFNLENLEYGKSYIVCLMKASHYTVLPTNCQTLTVPLEWINQSWITNGHKIPVIITAVTILIFIVLFSVCGIYVYFKKNPYLIYGKENVIVVARENSKKGTELEQNYEQHKYPPSLISWSDGYITPKVYESVEEFSVPCIDQCPSEYFGPRVYPTVRIGNRVTGDMDITYQNSAVYESVNFNPSLYYMDDDFSRHSYTSL